MIAIQRKQGLGGSRYEPPPQDIRQACAAIQATWSPRERVKRYRGPWAAWWIPPTIRLAGLFTAVQEERADSLPYFGATGNEADR